jgi:hypothetical protein
MAARGGSRIPPLFQTQHALGLTLPPPPFVALSHALPPSFRSTRTLLQLRRGFIKLIAAIMVLLYIKNKKIKIKNKTKSSQL